MVATVGLLLFLFSFASGMSTTPWTLNSEIYPIHVIGTANSLSAFTNWTTNAIVAEVFPLLTSKSTAWKVVVYCCLGLFSVLCYIFTYLMIPETSGKTIDAILDQILGTSKHSAQKKVETFETEAVTDISRST